MAEPRNCGTCKWLKIDRSYSMTKHKPPRWKDDAGGQCVWPVPEIVLAKSITTAYGYRTIGLSRNYMRVQDANCPTWEALNG